MANAFLYSFFSRLRRYLLSRSRIIKSGFVMLVDLLLCVFSVWVAYALRLGDITYLVKWDYWASGFYVSASCAAILGIVLLSIFGGYRVVFRHSGWSVIVVLMKASVAYGLVYSFIFFIYGVPSIPRTLGLIQPVVFFFLLVLSRMFAHLVLGGELQEFWSDSKLERTLIYGCGVAGRQLSAALSASQKMKIVGFISDEKSFQGQVLNGYPVYDSLDVVATVEKCNADLIILALPQLSRDKRNQILDSVREARVAVRTIPRLSDESSEIFGGLPDVQDLDLDDLLCRDPVVPYKALMSKKITGRTVLVTGAGGSIGSELSRQIISLKPTKLLILDHNEFALYRIHQELQELNTFAESVVVPLLGSVNDTNYVLTLLSGWRVDAIYHTAAYKHVPIVEQNVVNGVKNNVFGTLNLAKLALENRVSDFVLISTDKAVRPTNVMGASKRLAEMVLQSIGQYAASKSGRTIFSIVRFGNVLGSSGSVVPRFRQQIRAGGPVTLTHPEVVRYFMTIPEAAQLVIQAGGMAESGNIFILDMGDPVAIRDLAERMIELSGHVVRSESSPQGTIDIKITGLRPGEKLFEELLIGEDSAPTEHPRIIRAREEFLSWEILKDELRLLEHALNSGDIHSVIKTMRKLVSGYEPSDDAHDLVYSSEGEISKSHT